MGSETFASSDRELVVSKRGQNQNHGQRLLTSAVAPGVVRRTHVMFADGTHILDQVTKVRSIIPSGTNRCYELPEHLKCIDVSPLRGSSEENKVAVLTKSDDAATKQRLLILRVMPNGNMLLDVDLELPEPDTAVKAEGHEFDEGANLAVLFRNGDLRRFDLAKAVPPHADELAPEPRTVLWAKAADAGHVAAVLEGTAVSDVSLATDGKIYVALQAKGVVSTLHGATLAKLSSFRADSQTVLAVRAMSGVAKGPAVASHVVAVLCASSDDGADTRLTTFHVKEGPDATWQPWRTQGVSFPGFHALPILEASANGEALCIAGKTHLAVVRLSAALESSGRVVRGAGVFDCGSEYGGFVSVVVKSDSGGVRVSARRTNGVVIHDVGLDSLALSKSQQPGEPGDLDACRHRIKELERERGQLQEEVQALHRDKGVHASDISRTLRLTVDSIEKTVAEMNQFRQTVDRRIAAMEEQLRRSASERVVFTKEGLSKLERSQVQVSNLIDESTKSNSTDLQRRLALMNTDVQKLKQDVENQYSNLLKTVKKSQQDEVAELTKGLADVIKSLLSEPGLMRLREELLTDAAFKDAAKQVASSCNEAMPTLKEVLREHTEKVTQQLLEEQRSVLKPKMEGMAERLKQCLEEFIPEVRSEVELGMRKLAPDVQRVKDRENELVRKLEDLQREGISAIEKIRSEPLPAQIELMGLRRMLQQAVERDRFWTEGMPLITGASDAHRRELLLRLEELWAQRQPFGGRPASGGQVLAFLQSLQRAGVGAGLGSLVDAAVDQVRAFPESALEAVQLGRSVPRHH